MSVRPFAAMSLALGLALATGRARADDLPPRTFQLDVQAGPGCPGAEGVHDALALALRTDPVEPQAGARLVVELLQVGELARGRWEMRAADGRMMRERSVSVTASCRQLVTELALTFAVFYETPPAAACPPPTCDATCRAAAREEARRELLAQGYRPPMDFSAFVMAGGLLSANLTADPGGGFFLAGGAAGEVLSGALEVRVLLPARVVDVPTGNPFQITAMTAALVPCGQWKVLQGCAVVDLGMLVAGGSVRPVAGAPVIATLGVGPRLGVVLPLGDRFSVRAFAEMRFAPVSSGFRFVDTASFWQSEIVAGLFGLGVGFK